MSDMTDRQYYNAMGGDGLFSFLHATSDETKEDKDRRLGLLGGDSAGVNRSGLSGTPATPRPLNKEQADLNIAPNETTVPYASAENRRGRGDGTESDIGSFLPTDLHNDTQSHNNEQQLDAQTDTNTHNIQSGDKGSLGNSEDAPTAPNTHNRATQVVSLVVDELGDQMTNYLLHKNQRRRLGSTFDTISQMGNMFNFASNAYTNPVGTIGKVALRGAVKKLTGLDGQNAFEALLDNGKLTDEETDDIKLRQMGLFRAKQRIAQNHLGIDDNGDMYVKVAKTFLELKDKGETEINKPNRMKAPTTKRTEFIKHPALIPYIVLSIVFYQALHDKSFSIDNYHSKNIVSEGIIKMALKTILTDVLNLGSNEATLGLYVFETIPNQLITAYHKNIDKKTGLFKDEHIAIQEFVKGIEAQFNSLYGKSLQKAVKELQGQNINIWTNLAHLDTDDVLHSIATQLLTADSLIWESMNNTGLFLGLVELTSIHKKGMGDLLLSNNNIGNEYYAEGVVRYLGKNRLQQKLEDPTINAMIDIERNNGQLKIKGGVNTGLYKNGNDYIVAIKGSKMPTDLQPNLDNVAGSEEILNTDRYTEADELLDEAQKLADKSGGEVHIIGHSLGGLIATHLATKHQSVKAHIYDPVIAKNDTTKKMLKETQHSNIDFHIIENSPISANLESIFEDSEMMGYNIESVIHKYRQKRMSSHSVMNFV